MKVDQGQNLVATISRARRKIIERLGQTHDARILLGGNFVLPLLLNDTFFGGTHVGNFSISLSLHLRF